jgi:hypothetical protein
MAAFRFRLHDQRQHSRSRLSSATATRGGTPAAQVVAEYRRSQP